MEGPIAALLAQNYAILDSFKQNMQTWRVRPLNYFHVHLQQGLQWLSTNASVAGGLQQPVILTPLHRP